MMSRAQVLILDDLGAERRKGDYQDDYAAAEIDYIVASARYRACLPTWYTTNIPLERLAAFYGARFASRLVSESPLVELVGPDRRVSA
jgi:DNA replication protein DnaC